MKKFFLSIIIILAAWFIGLLWFISSISHDIDLKNIHADAIVVLTGGKGRVVEGINLLSQNKANKLLISGVGQNANIAALKTLSNELASVSFSHLEDRITLGHFATNTKENAVEALEWMEENHFKSMILVTSSYHIKRSLLEFNQIMPGITIFAHPVSTNNFKLNKWWKFPGTAKLIFIEYNKYLAIKFFSYLI